MFLSWKLRFVAIISALTKLNNELKLNLIKNKLINNKWRDSNDTTLLYIKYLNELIKSNDKLKKIINILNNLRIEYFERPKKKIFTFLLIIIYILYLINLFYFINCSIFLLINSFIIT